MKSGSSQGGSQAHICIFYSIWLLPSSHLPGSSFLSSGSSAHRKSKKRVKTKVDHSGETDSPSATESPDSRSTSNGVSKQTTTKTAATPATNCDSAKRTKKSHKKLSIFSFWESQVLSAPKLEEDEPPSNESPTTFPAETIVSSSSSAVKTEINDAPERPLPAPSPTTSSAAPLPPKMVIAIDHSYAKNWEDLAFSPWNPAAEAVVPAATKVETKAETLGDDDRPAVVKQEGGWESNGATNDVKPTFLKSIVADDMKDVVLNGLKNNNNSPFTPASSEPNKKKKKKDSSLSKPVLTRLEIQGFGRLMEVLDKNPPQDVPEAIGSRAGALLEAGRKLLAELEADLKKDPEKEKRGVTGIPFLTRFSEA